MLRRNSELVCICEDFYCARYAILWYVTPVVPKFFVMITVPSTNSLQKAMVGDSQDIECSVDITFDGVEPNSVIFRWFGPKGTIITNNSRITVTPTIASTNTFASSLQFSYLMEGDEGNYTCNVIILRTTESDSVELRRLDG